MPTRPAGYCFMLSHLFYGFQRPAQNGVWWHFPSMLVREGGCQRSNGPLSFVLGALHVVSPWGHWSMDWNIRFGRSSKWLTLQLLGDLNTKYVPRSVFKFHISLGSYFFAHFVPNVILKQETLAFPSKVLRTVWIDQLRIVDRFLVDRFLKVLIFWWFLNCKLFERSSWGCHENSSKFYLVAHWKGSRNEPRMK